MFSGINVDNLNLLIRKNNFYLNSINKNKNKIVANSNELNSCYDGKSLSFIFSKIMDGKSVLKKFPDIIESYSNILYGVGQAYQKQDFNVRFKIERDSSKLQ